MAVDTESSSPTSMAAASSPSGCSGIGTHSSSTGNPPIDYPALGHEPIPRMLPIFELLRPKRIHPPSYTFDGHTYAALATQAAYAVATTTTLANDAILALDARPLTPSNDQAKWYPLAPEQQETIAKQLCAWAGLQGEEEQIKARDSLEERRKSIVASSTSQAQSSLAAVCTALPPSSSESTSQAANAAEPSQAASFFPPDFASHYKAQLQALAVGFYSKLHREGLNKDHTATAPMSGTDLTTNDAELAAAVAARAQMLEMPTESVAAVLLNAAPPTTPSLAPGGQDPNAMVKSAASAAGVPIDSEVVLDQLLRFAHHLYQTGSRVGKSANGKTITRLHPTLLALLHTLHAMHPTHLPTLLLLSCAYYSEGSFAASLFWNDRILSINPGYVEAMSNIGTTLRALGRQREAESWWSKVSSTQSRKTSYPATDRRPSCYRTGCSITSKLLGCLRELARCPLRSTASQ